MKESVHLLQMRHHFPLRDTVIVKSHAIEHAGMQMTIHHAREEGVLGCIDHFACGGTIYLDALALM
jgi:hypothetical protein